jgi:hypothetical protein
MIARLLSLKSLSVAATLQLVVAFAMTAGWCAEPEQAEEILAATGVQRGFIVHLGCGDGKLTAA